MHRSGTFRNRTWTVSKTGGWGFESLHSCQRLRVKAASRAVDPAARWPQDRQDGRFALERAPNIRFQGRWRGADRPAPLSIWAMWARTEDAPGPVHGIGRESMAKTNPFEFLQQVRSEGAKVTWPSRKETLITTAMVFVMVVLASVFFLVVDQVVGWAVRAVIGLGG